MLRKLRNPAEGRSVMRYRMVSANVKDSTIEAYQGDPSEDMEELAGLL